MTDRDAIDAFLQRMREEYGERIDSVALPDGSYAYVEERVAAGDVGTLLFMLKLGYLMGLQTGFAAGRSGDDGPPEEGGGPMSAMEA